MQSVELVDVLIARMAPLVIGANAENKDGGSTSNECTNCMAWMRRPKMQQRGIGRCILHSIARKVVGNVIVVSFQIHRGEIVFLQPDEPSIQATGESVGRTISE